MGLNIKPLADRVLIEPLEAETKTASGLIIPDTAKEKPQKGIVQAVGNGTKENKMTCTPIINWNTNSIKWWKLVIKLFF